MPVEEHLQSKRAFLHGDFQCVTKTRTQLGPSPES